MRKQQIMGVLLAMFTFLTWGLLPIFWKELSNFDSVTILYHRIIWSCAVFMIIALFVRKISTLKEALFQPEKLGWIMASATLIAVNWGIYVYAVNSDHVLDASLGYYINPLFNVILGVIFLGEPLSRLQKLAFILAAVGVGIVTIQHGHLPIVSLALAGTLGIYGFIKKVINLDTITGMTAEGLVLLLPALYLAAESPVALPSISEDSYTWFLLIGSGFATAIPLLTFTAAAKRIKLSTLGFMQYIGPTCNFILAVKVYNEPFTKFDLMAFIFVWVGLACYMSGFLKLKRNKPEAIESNDEQGKVLAHALPEKDYWQQKIEKIAELSTGPLKKLDGILLDDQELNLILWNTDAKKRDKNLLSAKTIDDFLSKVSSVDRETPLYIDRHLGENVLGDDLARYIYEGLGFKNIFITTGEEDQDTPPYWITKIIGKAPPKEWRESPC